MKWLELVYGAINLESNSCVELAIDQDKLDHFCCRLFTDNKATILFSFEDKRDAKIFCRNFWKRLSHFLHDQEEYFLELKGLIQKSLEDLEKETSCNL